MSERSSYQLKFLAAPMQPWPWFASSHPLWSIFIGGHTLFRLSVYSHGLRFSLKVMATSEPWTPMPASQSSTKARLSSTLTPVRHKESSSWLFYHQQCDLLVHWSCCSCSPDKEGQEQSVGWRHPHPWRPQDCCAGKNKSVVFVFCSV